MLQRQAAAAVDWVDVVLTEDQTADSVAGRVFATEDCSVEQVSAALAACADPAAGAEVLAGLPVTHPQVFLALTRRLRLTGPVRRALFDAAMRGPEEFRCRGAAPVWQLELDAVDWLTASLRIERLTPLRARRLLRIAGGHLPYWDDDPGWVRTVRVLRESPAVTQVGLAGFLAAAADASGAGQEQSLYHTARREQLV